MIVRIMVVIIPCMWVEIVELCEGRYHLCSICHFWSSVGYIKVIPGPSHVPLSVLSCLLCTVRNKENNNYISSLLMEELLSTWAVLEVGFQCLSTYVAMLFVKRKISRILTWARGIPTYYSSASDSEVPTSSSPSSDEADDNPEGGDTSASATETERSVD